MSNPISNRYDFVLFYDVENGNPNGDPDAGNMPRMDVETGYGLVTDVCIKRKIRNYIEAVHEGEAGREIYIKDGVPLNRSDNRAFEEVGVDPEGVDKKKIQKNKRDNPKLDVEIRDFMCRTFYDVRTFGAVMTTFVKNNLNCGQVRGPVQITFSKSVDPIPRQEVTITRVAITTEEDAKEKDNEMGRKYIVPYALYRCEGFVSANLARRVTGFSEEDLELLWESLIHMFDFDRSAARGKMAVRKLIVFKHDSELGNAPAHQLFEAVHVQKREGVASPRAFTDYTEITIDQDMIPAGVEVINKV